MTYFALAGITSLLLIPAVAAGRKLGQHRPDLRLDAGRRMVGPRRPNSILRRLSGSQLPLAIGTIRTIRRDIH